MKKNKRDIYMDRAEVWFDEHYRPMGLFQYLICWWYGIDPRKSAVIMVASYLSGLKTA